MLAVAVRALLETLPDACHRGGAHGDERNRRKYDGP